MIYGIRIALAMLVTALAFAPPAVFAANVTIFAAASLKDALDAQAKAFEAATGSKVIVSYGASNALARQIEAGHLRTSSFPPTWTGWIIVAQRKLIAAETRFNLLHNTLVLIAPSSSPASLKIGPKFALAAALRSDKLAMANPDSVPAGKYAKSALDKLGVWSSVEKQLARTENVRIALMLVSRGEAPVRHRVQDGRARRQGRQDRRYVSRRTAIPLSSTPRRSSPRAHRRPPGRFSITCAASPRRWSGKDTDSGCRSERRRAASIGQ
jgi:molybdate transport system substrate-binding protein